MFKKQRYKLFENESACATLQLSSKLLVLCDFIKKGDLIVKHHGQYNWKHTLIS